MFPNLSPHLNFCITRTAGGGVLRLDFNAAPYHGVLLLTQVPTRQLVATRLIEAAAYEAETCFYLWHGLGAFPDVYALTTPARKVLVAVLSGHLLAECASTKREIEPAEYDDYARYCTIAALKQVEFFKANEWVAFQVER